MDLYGTALLDYFKGFREETLLLNNSYGEPEEMPVDVFFRDEEDMPELEIVALKHCRGKTLDVGAGAGSHSLILQERLDTTALEISAIASDIMKKRGIEKIVNHNYFDYKAEMFDTLLLLMNGLGLSGTIEGLKKFLEHSKTIVKPGGQIIFDSSDIRYLYEDGIPLPSAYYGEISYQYEYKGDKDQWFDWLYIDQNTLSDIAGKVGWKLDILFEDDHDQYLGRLTFS